MDEQFDNELKNHISKVFENFEDLSADAGWLLLRKKFPEKEKDRGFIWLWLGSAAAILLMVLGIGVWIINHQEQPQKLSFKVNNNHSFESAIAKQSNPAINGKDTLRHKPKPLIADNTLSYRYTNSPTSRFNNSDDKSYLAASNQSANKPITSPLEEKPMVIKPTEQTRISKNSAIESAALTVDTVSKTPSLIAIQKPVIKPNTPLFTEKYGVKDHKTEINPINAKNIEFGIYAATYFNYAKGSNNQVNVGAGVTADIAITKNLKISTGLAIAQNSLDYNNQFTAIAASNIGAQIGLARPDPAFNNYATYAIPVLKNYSAQLVGLDLPVNLKYEFNPQKSNSYVSVGLSSGTFINQSYNYQYNTLSQQTQTTTNSSLNSFYFAKTLNVSFGLGYPIGKTNRLTIEPFLKYPLDGLGAQQIRFGASGLNLKFDFQPSKK